ncbi:hypothetical protein ACQJBY_057057 [Aegilops geniculata]
METQQEPTKAGAMVAGEPAGGGAGLLESKICFIFFHILTGGLLGETVLTVFQRFRGGLLLHQFGAMLTIIDRSVMLPAADGPPAPKTAQQGPAAPPGSATDRDAVLAKVEMNRKLSMVNAWEENQKSKADNRAEHKMSSILSWENTKKAAVQAKLRTREEKLERKKAEYAEKMRNRMAMIHKEAEEQRAVVEARRQEEMIKCQETAAKHRSQGTTPKKKFLSCFG